MIGIILAVITMTAFMAVVLYTIHIGLREVDKKTKRNALIVILLLPVALVLIVLVMLLLFMNL